MTCSPTTTLPTRRFVLRGIAAAATIAGAGTVVGCWRLRRRRRIAVTIFPLYDLVRRIAGDDADIVLVLPSGRTPHDFKPTAGDIDRVRGVDAFIAAGFGLDGWMAGAVNAAGRHGVEELSVAPLVAPLFIPEVAMDNEEEAEGAKEEEERESAGYAGPRDPHVWLDPLRMQKAVGPIVEFFVKVSGRPRARFEPRAEALRRSLGDLHARTLERSRKWRRRSVAAMHGSLTYYAARYRINVPVVVQPDADKPRRGEELDKLYSDLAAFHPFGIFAEPQIDRVVAIAASTRSGIPLFELDPLGGAPPLDSYERVIDGVTDALEQALA